MAGTPEGALKAAARRIGISVEEYVACRASGLRWCTRCKSWKPAESFGKDCTRADGRAASCLQCGRVAERVCTKGRPSAFRGRAHSDAARAAMSAASKGRPSNRLGVPHAPETRAKISARLRQTAARGPRAPGYVDGMGAVRQGQRATAELKRWRYDVFSRDGFMCVHCGDDQGGNLHAHHIRPFATHPDLRFDTRNGVTLCENCHGWVHAYGLQLWSPTQ